MSSPAKKTSPGSDDGSKPLKAPTPHRGYSYTCMGQKVSDEQIKEFIMEEISAMVIRMAIRNLRPACKKTIN